MQTFFEILSKGERVIVASDESERTIITWNRSITFQAWVHHGSDQWEEVSIRTYGGGGDPSFTFESAEQYAQAWLCEGIGDDR